MTKPNRFRLLLTAAVLVAGSLTAFNARAAVGDIYESNQDMILRIKPSGTQTPSTFTQGLANPKGLVFDGNGILYVADASTNSIYRFSVPDGAGTTYIQNLSSPVAVTFDLSGNFYVGEAGSGNVLKFTPDGTRTTFASGLGATAGLAFANSGGNLFVSDFAGNKIYQVTPAGVKSQFASNVNAPAGLAFDSAGFLFVADSGSGSILKFAPDGTRTVFATTLSEPYGVAFEANGNLIVSDHGNGSTFRFAPTGERATVFSSNFNTPQFVAIEPKLHEFLNISTRGFIQGGDHILIAGFIIGGSGPVGTRVVIRGIGPSLPSSITDPLPDPVLEVRDASGALIAMNNDWQDAPDDQKVDGTFAPTNVHEAALKLVLHGGTYTAILYGGGAGATSGTAVVEAYNTD